MGYDNVVQLPGALVRWKPHLSSSRLLSNLCIYRFENSARQKCNVCYKVRILAEFFMFFIAQSGSFASVQLTSLQNPHHLAPSPYHHRSHHHRSRSHYHCLAEAADPLHHK